FPCGIDARRWLALAVAETDRFPRCPEGVSLLYGPPACKTHTPHLAASAFRHQIQRNSTRRVLFRSGRRVPLDPHRLRPPRTYPAGPSTNRCSSLGWLQHLAATTERVSGTSG